MADPEMDTFIAELLAYGEGLPSSDENEPAAPAPLPGAGEPETFTITFGDAAEPHVGMGIIPAEPLAGERAGFTHTDLFAAAARFREAGCVTEVAHLPLPGRAHDPAWVLVAKGGAAALGITGGLPALADELRSLSYDTKAWMKGGVKNKRARHCVCLAPAGEEPDYPRKRGRVIPFAGAPRVAEARAALPGFFGPEAAGLVAEVNRYFDPRKCGIRPHGDGERRLVVGVRVGRPMPLVFQWHLGKHRLRLSDEPGAPLARTRFELASGDVYAMSAKAVGRDWLKKSFPTLRHSAGTADEYVG